MTALVFGATGFVGREVVRQLCVRGARVVAHVRPDSSRLATWRETFDVLGAAVDTTAWQLAPLTARLRELAPAQIYVLIGTTRSRARTDQVVGDIYRAVDLGLTRLVVDAARAAGGQPRIAYLSSVGASREARTAYLRARGEAEDVVIASGLPYVIARPSIITGDREEARLGERTAGVVGDAMLAVAGVFGARKLRATYRSTTPDILASALIRHAEGPAANVTLAGDDLR